MKKAGYKRFPTINKDRVVFVSEDDLWEAPVSGGKAVRLTSNEGHVSHPHFSPDGKYIAFTGREEGQADVYVIPSEGGVNKRLTFMGKNTRVIGWTPDGKHILFVSFAFQPLFQNEIYKVSLKGGLPEKYPFGNTNAISFGPGKRILLGRNTHDPAIWKRYKGGTAGVLWIDNTGNGKFEVLINLKGNITSPLWIGDRIYFISDHEGIGRLYSCTPGGNDLQCHTRNKVYYIRNATTDGKNVVFHEAGEIYYYNVDTGETKHVEVDYSSPYIQRQRKFVKAEKYLESYNIHPNGESLAINSRGKGYTFPNQEGPVWQVGKRHGVRYRFTQWLYDKGSTVTVSDDGGYEVIEVYKKGKSKCRKYSKLDIGRAVTMKASPTEDKVVLSNHKNELLIIDLKENKISEIAVSEFERIYDFSFSPDGKWLVYSMSETDFLYSLFLYNIDSGKNYKITSTSFMDVHPTFDPQGKFIYFLSYRDFNPVYDDNYFQLGFPLGNRAYLISLQKDTPSPFTKNYKQLFLKNKNNGKGKKTKKPIVKIDLKNIEDRIISFPLPEAGYKQIVGIQDGVLLTHEPIKGSLDHDFLSTEIPKEAVLIRFDFIKQKSETVTKNITNFKIAQNGKSLVYRSGNKLNVNEDIFEEKPPSSTSKNGDGWINLNRVKVCVEPVKEWRQMYDEAWRLQREHFWNPDMSGVDWDLVYKRYLPLLDKIASRSEFSDLIWEMQGELGTSHAYEFGGDYRQTPIYTMGLLGADFKYDKKEKAYKIIHIVKGDSWKEGNDSPLNNIGIDVKKGDYIIAINGFELDGTMQPNALLVNQVGNFVRLSIKSAATGKVNDIDVKTISNDKNARYREWVDKNRVYVYKRSKGKLGYVHIPDMGPYGYSEFHRYYIYESERDGLIVDVRSNRGGHVSQLILEKLSRKHIGYSVPRYGRPGSYPLHSVAGPIVALTDEYSGSDGDIFSHNFKQMKIGPLVGKRTWGGVIGINPIHALVDGSLTTQPEYANWMKDVKWGVENYGTDPDIEVEITPQDYAKGKDPQIDTAIQTALDQLKKHPIEKPDFDKRPVLKLPETE